MQETRPTSPSETGLRLSNNDLLGPLRLEHSEILDQVGTFEKAIGSDLDKKHLHDLLRKLLLTLERHCSQEEATLVRALCQARGEDWLESSVHNLHRSLIEALSDLLGEDEKAAPIFRAHAENFIQSLRAHLSAEENVLFWLAEQSLRVRETSDLSAVA